MTPRDVDWRSVRAPDTYAESFTLAAGAGIIDADLAAVLRPSVGLRNVLVHDYLDVDQEVVVSAVGVAVDQYGEYVPGREVRPGTHGLTVRRPVGTGPPRGAPRSSPASSARPPPPWSRVWSPSWPTTASSRACAGRAGECGTMGASSAVNRRTDGEA